MQCLSVSFCQLAINNRFKLIKQRGALSRTFSAKDPYQYILALSKYKAAHMDFLSPRPRILISNDDGINAPGLRALVAALHAGDFCDIAVCGPAGERSAQSHAITLRSPMLTFPIEVEGTDEAYAVEGTPADSVMLALHGPVLKVDSMPNTAVLHNTLRCRVMCTRPLPPARGRGLVSTRSQKSTPRP